MMHRQMRSALRLSVSILLGVSAASFGEPFGVQLLRLDSLIGWDHGIQPLEGWTIGDGRLTGSGDSTPLLSGWTFGDFQLRLRWSVTEDGVLTLTLADVPSGEGLEFILCEGDDCGRLMDGEVELSPGAGAKPLKGNKMHTAAIHRNGSKLSLTVDGRWINEVRVKTTRRFGLGLAVRAGRATVADLRLQEAPGRPMFNGKDFTGWSTPGDITPWRIKGDQVVFSGEPHDYLRTEKEYANFTWSMELKMQRRGNSGLGIRTPHQGWPSADGMEMQVLCRPYLAEMKNQPYMAIYGYVLPLSRADLSERWNRIIIKAEGYMISAWVNGELVQQVNTFYHPELKHRHLQGWLGIKEDEAWIRARNVRLLEAPTGLGLTAWYKPRSALGVTAILDRLINPERLTLPDGTQSGAALKTFSEEEKTEHLLAELTGPGAVVRIAHAESDGQLAFHFDGEEKPRIECPLDELRDALPPVGNDSHPMLTCLAYHDSLKIVVRDAAKGEYRFDYVTLPTHAPVESFTDLESCFPRGWMPTVTTVLRWLESGRFHGYDTLPRFGGEKQTVDPGETKLLAQVDGTGIVHSLTLQADNRVLENNDLWLEVTVDEEDRPAISAPARYIFPALTKNYANYVLQDQGGPTNRLAMPFSDGISVSASNRGGRPIENVGGLLVVQRATDANAKETTGRMRLRGVFQPARDRGHELISQNGTGRWIGLICQLTDEEPTAIASLLVDGRPVVGWSAASLAPFLGGTGDFRGLLSGRQGTLCWRYLMLAPVGFQKSLVLKTRDRGLGERLALFYLEE